ncbi:aminoacyl-tRNA hydrolase [Stappia sp. MMSF_3263]|uniref:aminoacyl-tRNA hydrolase n=1 Tax=Stappia sp. MMSF_3263 TaxID=3046693 RepID=UPI00273E8D66|nr:aminoacyl-tRNA hydrolase [Stappia sp. MMSF_3263]
MRLIVGLGNPGAKYARNRHNIGFLAVDAIHGRNAGFGPWRSRFQAEVSEGVLEGDKVLLMKPQTYMNESGRSVGDAARFYKLTPADVIVLYDELDLAPGKVRTKVGGGSGGHNGIRSIDAHLGKEYSRVRLGIGHPGHKDRVTAHVLGDFAKVDADWLDPLLDAVASEAGLLVGGHHSEFCNRLHRAVGPAKPDRQDRPKAPSGSRAPVAAPPLAGLGGDRKGPGGALAEQLARMFGKKD